MLFKQLMEPMFTCEASFALAGLPARLRDLILWFRFGLIGLLQFICLLLALCAN